MKSTIRVAMDFNKKEPVLQINLDKESTDLADETLKNFIESANDEGMFIFFPFADDIHNLKPQIRLKNSHPDDATGFIDNKQLRQNVKTNSIMFRKWLDDQGIEWSPNGSLTTIIGDYDKYDIGYDFGRYYAANAPRP